jgi:hypothetical protein
LVLAGVGTASAQPIVNKNAALRYEIDAKKKGVNLDKEEALFAARDFIRIDSTYYVGWMMQGIYLSNIAADYVGYKNAIAPLEKALQLMESDYKAILYHPNPGVEPLD